MMRIPSKPVPLALLMALLAVAPARGADVPDLYVAQVPATGLSGPPLEDAFARALDLVLVKVTGQRDLAASPAQRRAVGAPGPLVRQYQPVPGGGVRVSFDPAGLRRRLDAANLPVWADDRPVTVVYLDEPAAPAGAAAAPGGRALFSAAAAARGIPVSFRAGPGPAPDEGTAAGTGGPVLAGRAVPTAGPGVFRWSFSQGGDREEWQGDAAAGAHGVADRLARRYAAVASSGQLLRVRFTGVQDFDAYGRLQAYLGTVGLIRSAELRQVAAGDFIYDLSIRGTPAQLDDAFALRGLLEPAADPAPGAAELVYRLVAGLPAAAPGP